MFVPGWKSCKDCLFIAPAAQIDPTVPYNRLIRLGDQIDLSRFGKYAKVFLGRGWSVPENWGLWSQDKKASLELPLPAETPKVLLIDAQAFVNGVYPEQVVEVWINGVLQTTTALTKRFGNQINVTLPVNMLSSVKLRVELVFPRAISPKALGIGSDERPLAIGLEAVRY